MRKPNYRMTAIDLALFKGPTYRIECEPDCNGAALCDLYDISGDTPVSVELDTVVDSMIVYGEVEPEEREYAVELLEQWCEDRLLVVAALAKAASEPDWDSLMDQRRDDYRDGSY